jgi:DNA-binding transcriptional MocR family regulator
VEARPQSGYYVKYRPRGQTLEAEPAPADEAPTSVSIDELTLELYRGAADPGVARFGAASPDPELLPSARLDRILAELAREGRFAKDTSVNPEGLEELRVAIAQRAYLSGCPLTPQEIVITAGCGEAMDLCLRALCVPGDLVAIESPCYFGILLALEANHLRALEIPTNPGTGLSLEALEFALENHPVKAVLAMTNFSNPLGSTMPEENKRRLVEGLAARGIPLIENDIYGELWYGEKRPGVAKAWAEGSGGDVLLCSSFSKDISPGYRIGWVAAGRRAPDIRHLKMALNSGTSVLPQLTISRYLASGGYDLHLRKIRRAYARKLADMRRALGDCFPDGTRISDPEGGYVIWVRLPGGIDSLALYREALAQRITIAPGTIFSPSGKFRDYIRLSAAIWSEATSRDLERLGRLVEDMGRGAS